MLNERDIQIYSEFQEGRTYLPTYANCNTKQLKRIKKWLDKLDKMEYVLARKLYEEKM